MEGVNEHDENEKDMDLNHKILEWSKQVLCLQCSSADAEFVCNTMRKVEYKDQDFFIVIPKRSACHNFQSKH